MSKRDWSWPGGTRKSNCADELNELRKSEARIAGLYYCGNASTEKRKCFDAQLQIDDKDKTVIIYL